MCAFRKMRAHKPLTELMVLPLSWSVCNRPRSDTDLGNASSLAAPTANSHKFCSRPTQDGNAASLLQTLSPISRNDGGKSSGSETRGLSSRRSSTRDRREPIWQDSFSIRLAESARTRSEQQSDSSDGTLRNLFPDIPRVVSLYQKRTSISVCTDIKACEKVVGVRC